MATLAQVNLMDGLFTMLKGEPGTRKSTSALSYPRRQYWFSTDMKMESLVLPAKRWGIKAHEIEYDDYQKWDPVLAKLEQLQVNCPYKTIIVDSITSMGDAMTSQVRGMKNKDGSGKKIGNIPVSGFEEFNAESSAFAEMISKLKDIHKFHKVNIILIAHVVGQRKDNDANKLTHHSRIIVTGAEKIGSKIASYVTEAYHFNIEPGFNADAGEGKYGLFTSHTGNDYARTSLPLPNKIMFNDEPLYDRYVLPAIKKQMEVAPTVRIEDSAETPKPGGGGFAV
jgi:hypothetical protein